MNFPTSSSRSLSHELHERFASRIHQELHRPHTTSCACAFRIRVLALLSTTGSISTPERQRTELYRDKKEQGRKGMRPVKAQKMPFEAQYRLYNYRAIPHRLLAPLNTALHAMRRRSPQEFPLPSHISATDTCGFMPLTIPVRINCSNMTRLELKSSALNPGRRSDTTPLCRGSPCLSKNNDDACQSRTWSDRGCDCRLKISRSNHR